MRTDTTPTRAPRRAHLLLLGLGLLSVNGCAFRAGVDETFEPSGLGQVDASTWPEAKVYFRTFKHQAVTGRSVGMATGPGGGVAVASAETVGTLEHVPTWILTEAARAFPFQSITPVTGMGKKAPTFILEGRLSFAWDTRWWSWVQLVDLWIHSWFLPTLGRYLELEFELNLFDAEHQLLRTWKATRTIKYVGQIWWLISHGGAGGSGFEEDYREYLSEVFQRVGDDMRALVRRSSARRGS